eukprot:TRINITY_DN4154_c4_g1_i1.p1 TRINITY_DN4154_c4_g1~~TRINITY_DN4154_c4_g1_i1.p1  ORF type:complete len:646 (+),score=309.88 TRINITY_DN4154_c4_g1_i1:54-1991(+)
MGCTESKHAQTAAQQAQTQAKAKGVDVPAPVAAAVAGIAAPINVVTKETTPVAGGQKPGTSGLRKKTRQFMEPGFLENFVQSVYNTLIDQGVKVAGGTVCVSGDGRYWNRTAVQTLVKMSLANGVKTVWVAQGGLMSTPGMSAVIRDRNGGSVPFGGFILSASHNPGGIDEDFGIKYNCENGGPAPEKVTDGIFEHTKTIKEYKTLDDKFPEIDIDTIGATQLADGASVDVFSTTDDHLAVLKKCFDFDAIKALVARDDFSMVYDCMNGVQGPYAQEILVKELGVPADAILNGESREDFGGPDSAHHGHADPNLTHARALVAKMGLDKTGRKVGDGAGVPDFGAAADGDADRNMIVGKQFFVSPSDSLAVIAANAKLLPCFKDGLKGCARSMPTSCALDRVAEALNIPYFETPTGWKYFGNLMDAPGAKYSPFLCGEESFGTGSDHVREKDGLWAVLAWLQILAGKNEAGKPLVTVEDVVREHWKTYGRNYYARYDYEGVSKDVANQLMDRMKERVENVAEWSAEGFELAKADNFSYNDPIDSSVSKNQGIRWIFADGSRIVFRLSGTGVSGATVRLYLEKYVAPEGDLDVHPFEMVRSLAERAMHLSGMPELFPADKAAEKEWGTGARLGLEAEDGVCNPNVIT